MEKRNQANSSSVNLEIRQAVDTDVNELLRLLPQLSTRPDAAQAQMPDKDTAIQNLNGLLANEFVQLLVAATSSQTEQPVRIVGTLLLLIVPNLTHSGRPWAQIENVVVDQSVRRQGIGRQLINVAVDHARSRGCYKVQLISGPKPEQLVFYSELGFDTTICNGFKRYLDN